jgi:hypothetical protein
MKTTSKKAQITTVSTVNERSQSQMCNSHTESHTPDKESTDGQGEAIEALGGA